MRRESCSRCGLGQLQRDLVDVVIMVKGDKPYAARWCKPCAAECESKHWFSYAGRKKATTEGSAGETETPRAPGANPEPTEEPAVSPAREKPKVSGWQLMKAKYPTAALAQAAVEGAKSSGKSAGTIRVLEGLLKMRQKEETQ